MATPKSIGAIELSSIGVGYRVEDAMLKSASVQIVVARTICSGKYFIILAGPVSDVQSAIRAGLAEAGEFPDVPLASRATIPYLTEPWYC